VALAIVNVSSITSPAGLLSIASSSFLIAITRREQVAQIFGKPVYVVTDVAFLPLSSQREASKSITAAVESANARDFTADSDFSDSETEDAAQRRDEAGTSPQDDDRGHQRERGGTNIAQDVFAKRGQFGQFASHWFSRQGWDAKKSSAAESEDDSSSKNTKDSRTRKTRSPSNAAEKVNAESKESEAKSEPTGGINENTPVTAMIPKILRVSRMILVSRSFFFAYDIDLTRSLKTLNGSPQPPTPAKMDLLVRSMRHIGHELNIVVLLEQRSRQVLP
jgi:hypothetical protein